MTVIKRPDETVFASLAKDNEVQSFPDMLRGWGITFDQTNGIPPMEWFNDLFKRLDEKDLYILQRGLPEWSKTTDYPINAFVQNNGKTYRSLKANINQLPMENSIYWAKWSVDYADLVDLLNKKLDKTALSSSLTSESETNAATSKAAKTLKDLINALTSNLTNYIPNSKKSNAVNSNSADNVATSVAVKTAYDKGVEAKNAADNALSVANGKQSPATTLGGYGITDGVKQVDMRTSFGTGVAYQNSTPAQLPYGSFVGLTSNALLNSQTNHGWMFITKGWGDSTGYYSSTRFGIANNTLYFQQAKDFNSWGDAQQVATKGTTLGHYGITNAVLKTGDTMTGVLNLNYGNGYSQLNQHNKDGKHVRWEAAPDEVSDRFAQVSYRKTSPDAPLYIVKFPKNSGVVALDSDVAQKVNKSGDTMTGSLIINSDTGIVRGQRSGANAWYVGFTGSGSKDVRLDATLHGSYLVLQENQVFINKDLQLPANGAVIFGSNDRANKNVDHIHFSDTDNQPGTYYFCADADYKGKDAGTMADIATGWLRTYGNKGWYSQTYGGGWYMIDATWLRAYGNKKIYTANTDTDAIYTAGGIKANGGFYVGNNPVPVSLTTNRVQFGWDGNKLKFKIDNTQFGALHESNQSFVDVTAKDASYAGLRITRTGSSGDYLAHFDNLPDKRWRFWIQNSHEIFLPVKSGTVALRSDVEERISRTGDTMTGELSVPTLKITANNINKGITIGDDAILADVSVAHSVGVISTTNQKQGYFAFGTDKKCFGWDGSKFYTGGPSFVEGDLYVKNNNNYPSMHFVFSDNSKVILDSSKNDYLLSFSRLDTGSNVQNTITIPNGKSGMVALSGDVVVLTGKIAHGGTIPLPSGFSESQCKWMIAPSVVYDNGTPSDINSFQFTLNGRVVSLHTENIADTSNRAFYMIIGVK
ncbi:shufflon system plasmid conjugative transfer pilus tip adhesin PilV [Lonepinella koalarum]|uniref:shufflon system plasmid conjugative transfer pilus tip adhesin PilV n=1 Tax=Lonepinella koalarum TaxID=53417 RepID=UPI003F6DB88A